MRKVCLEHIQKETPAQQIVPVEPELLRQNMGDWSIWMIQTAVFWLTYSLGYRFAPVLYRYGLSTVYFQMLVLQIVTILFLMIAKKKSIQEICVRSD